MNKKTPIEIQYLKEMGDKIKEARKAKGLNLRELGKICNIDYSHFCRIEKGNFNSQIITLKTIAEKLDVNVKDFL